MFASSYNLLSFKRTFKFPCSLLWKSGAASFPLRATIARRKRVKRGASVRPLARVCAVLGARPAQGEKAPFCGGRDEEIGRRRAAADATKGEKKVAEKKERVQIALPKDKAVSTLGRALWRTAFVFWP